MVNQRYGKAALVVIFLLVLGVVLRQRKEQRRIVKKSSEVGKVISLLQIHEAQRMLRAEQGTNQGLGGEPREP